MSRRPLLKGSTAKALLFMTIVILVSYWKLTAMRGVLITDDIFTSDIMNDGFPYRFYLGQALKAGEFPLWYPPVFGGFPLLARAESGICYPLNILLFGILPPYPALNIVILLTILTAAIGMYLYAREIGMDDVGALLAGFAFAYCGFLVSHLKHLSMVNSACWFPFGLLAIERALREDRQGPSYAVGNARALLWLGGVYALQNLAGHIQIAYYSALVYGSYFVARLFHRSRRRPQGEVPRQFFLRDRLVAWAAIAATIGVMISAVQLIPTYELVQRSQRAGGVSFDYASKYTFDPADLWSFLYPAANGEPATASYSGKGIYWEDYGYVGLLTLLLACVGLVARFRLWHTKFFALAAALALLLVLGKNTPAFEWAFQFLPGMKFFRFPTRLLFVVDAALALLGGMGLMHLKRTLEKKLRGNAPGWMPTAVAGIVLCAAVGDLLYFQLRQNSIVEMGAWTTPPQTAVLLNDEARSYRIFSQSPELTHILAFKTAHGWTGDLKPFVDQREFLQPSLHVLYGFSTPNGYAQLTPAYVVDIWGDQNRQGILTDFTILDNGRFDVRSPYKKLMSLHNVKTILSPLPIVGEGLLARERVGKVHVYENPDVLPRVFLVGAYQLVDGEKESLRLLVSDAFHPSREVVLFEEPGIAQRDSITGTARIVSSRANEVTVHVESPQGGILVLSDTHYPGWEAEVDGARVPVLRANHTMRAVPLQPGNATVRFLYRPRSVYWGLVVTLLGVLLLTIFMSLRRRPTA